MTQTFRRLWQDAEGAGSGGVCADNHPSQFVVGRRDESALATPMALLSKGEWPCVQVFRWRED